MRMTGTDVDNIWLAGPAPKDQYGGDLFTLSRWDKVGRIVELVGHGKSVLDIGCANGRMSRLFVENGCCVTGVEIDHALAQQALAYCDRVIERNVENEGSLTDCGHYDVVVMADVLEHFRDPVTLLRRLRTVLEPNGYIVAALPNVVFWTLRLRILFGRFQYTPTGLLCIDHLRFFNMKGAFETLVAAGYLIDEFYPAPWLFQGRRMSRLTFPYTRSVLRFVNGVWPMWWARVFPNLLAFTFVFKAHLHDDIRRTSVYPANIG
jgi:2-polyprenyl-3-methyl-5-hydroxy-6-metoxy-1,4-benzoquinol methylase